MSSAAAAAPPGVGFEYPPVPVSWFKRDVLLFANAIGCDVKNELHFLYVSLFFFFFFFSFLFPFLLLILLLFSAKKRKRKKKERKRYSIKIKKKPRNFIQTSPSSPHSQSTSPSKARRKKSLISTPLNPPSAPQSQMYPNSTVARSFTANRPFPFSNLCPRLVTAASLS
jgi:hypothetical protein